MRSIYLTTIMTAALTAGSAQAAPEPVGDKNPNAVDVAKTPVTDLNIDRKEIPDLLIKAQSRPYDLSGLDHCRALISAVQKFDNVLGPDFDLPQEARDRIDAGRVGKAVVGSFIPFRGIIREVSGANEHDRRVRAAIQAGLARRGFLKGVGQTRGCDYPARSATRKDVAAWMAARQSPEQDQDASKDNTDERKRGDGDVNYVSQPVVQEVD